MRHFLPLTAGALLLLSAGVVHGLWTNRWAEQGDLERATARLPGVPLTFGGWRGQDLELPKDARSALAGSIARRYVHPSTGKTVTLYIGCGRPGPTSVHTPDVCYAGTGFRSEAPQRYLLPAAAGQAGGEFWTAHFQKTQAAAQSHLRIFWAWRGEGADRWQVSDNPRVTFARYSVLFKLYVLREMASPTEPLADDPCLDFLKALLPELDRQLFPAAH
jgi:hypothetical protein